MASSTKPEAKVTSSQTSPTPPPASERWWAMAGLGLGIFLFALDVYIVNLAVPLMVESLHTSFSVIQWVIVSYLLAIAIFVLSASRLGDIFSKKRLYIIGLAIFTASSLGCALSPNIGWLIACRALQGLGASFMSGLGTAMIVEIFPPEQRGLGLGIRAGIYGLGITLGPSLGGFLLPWGGWPAIFWVNVPLGILGCLAVWKAVPESVGKGIQQGFDGLGTLLLTFTLTCFTLGMTLLQKSGAESVWVWALLGFAGVGLIGFLILESRLSSPMLDLSIFQSGALSLGLVLRLLGNGAMAGVIFVLPFFLELVQKYSPEKAGFLMAIPPLIIFLTAPVAGFFSDRFGPRIVSVIGLSLMATGCGVISTFDASLGIWAYLLGVIPYALGVGMFQSPNNSLIMGAAPAGKVGLTSGLLSLARILGQTIGVPLIGALFSFATLATVQLNAHLDVSQAPVESLLMGVQMSFRALTIVLVGSIILSLTFWRTSAEKPSA